MPTSTISPDGLWTVTEQVAPSGPFIVSVPPGQTASLNNPPVELVIVNVNVWDAHAGVTVVLQMMVPFALKPITWVPVGQEVPAALLGPGGPGWVLPVCSAGCTWRPLRPGRAGVTLRTGGRFYFFFFF